MIQPRRKEPMSNLIREHRMNVAHMNALVSGRVQPVDEDEPAPKRFTYSIVSDDRQSGWYDAGVGIRNDQTGLLMNDVPFQTHKKAEEFLEELENPEGSE